MEQTKSEKRQRSDIRKSKSAAIRERLKLRRQESKNSAIANTQTTPNLPIGPVRPRKRRRVHSKNVPVTKSIQIHRGSFLRWEISAVTAVATSPDGSLMAVARKSGCIELRRKSTRWITSFALRWDALDETAALSAMIFDTTGNYLLVGRFNGSLDIYSVFAEGLSLCATLDPGGGAIMALAMRPSRFFEVAIGCEDGRVRFLTIDKQFKELSLIENGSVVLPSTPSMYSVHRGHRSTGMCLSLSWRAFEDNSDGIIVCGDSMGGLRWMSGSDKRLVGRGTLPGLDGRETHVWTVQIVARGQQVVCGDSRGLVSVWCSKTFTKIEENRIEGMAGDIWTSAATCAEDDGSERVLFGCAGGSLASLKSLVSSNGSVSWVPIRGRTVHLNDIKAIAVLGEKGFVSASTDTRLCIFTSNQHNKASEHCMLLHYHEAAGQHPTQIVPSHGLVLSRQKDRVDFWQLAQSPEQDPTLALRLKLSAYRGNIRAFAISSDATRIAVAVLKKFCYYEVSERKSDDGSKVALLGNVTPITVGRETEDLFKGSEHLLFVGSTLIGISEDRQNLIILNGEKAVTVPKNQVGSTAKFLTHICGGSISEIIVVADSAGAIYVSRMGYNRFRQCANLGVERAVGCVQLSPSGETLAASLLDGTVVIISIGEGQSNVALMRRFPSLATCISFSPDENSVLLSGHNFCYITAWARKAAKTKTEGPEKVKKIVHVVSLQNSLIASGVIGPSSLFLAYRPWKSEQAFLPRVLPKKLYGI